MKATEKEQIKTKLAEYCETKGGQNKAANSMRSVSAATISQVLNNNWELISDEMWRTIASQIGYDPRAWVVVETRGYKRMYRLLRDAQDNSLVFAVTGDAGCGKSEAIKSYAASNRNVYNLSCSEYWNQAFHDRITAMYGYRFDWLHGSGNDVRHHSRPQKERDPACGAG